MPKQKTVHAQQQQYPLALKFDRELSFDNFWAKKNSEPIAALKALLSSDDPNWIYLAGGAGSGVSHLLQATSNEALKKNDSALYLSLAEVVNVLDASAESSGEQLAALFESLENYNLLCIDEIDCIASHRAYQEQLFYLLIRLQQNKIRLVMGAKNTPAALDVALADLRSRLAFASVYQLPAPSDNDKMHILQHRAARLGLDMGDEVARFMLNRCGRELATQLAMLEKLDTQALAQSRKLSVPFVKQVLLV